MENDDFAVVRPGGHHASKTHAEGFCLINSEAVPTQYLLNKGKRVAIIDIDAHHGNGTQDIFKNEENVLYSSIHQIGKYPYTGDINDVGGKGNMIINIPIRSGSGDDVFLKSIDYILNEIKKFNPDHVIIVAGFDGYGEDPLLSLNYSKQGYLEAAKRISKLKVPTFALLAGGYHDEVKGCADSFIAGFNDEKFNTTEKLTTSSYDCLNHLKLMFKYIKDNQKKLDKKSEIDKIIEDF
jgi:acetoin utilization deacetylase AcuC-like enzyme